MKAIMTFIVALILWCIVSWIGNLNQLLDCDFKAPYKCEVIHTIGIIPPVALVTVWFDTDN